MTHRDSSSNSRWGLIMGVVIACVCVLLGVIAGQRPDVILWRSTLSGIVLGGIANLFEQLLQQQFTDSTDENDDD